MLLKKRILHCLAIQSIQDGKTFVCGICPSICIENNSILKMHIESIHKERTFNVPFVLQKIQLTKAHSISS